MARTVCSPLKPIASYQVAWQTGGYQLKESSLQEQTDPYRDKLLAWLNNLSADDYKQNQRCLARADGVLLEIERRPDQDRARVDQAGSIYKYDVHLYKWPRLGWVWKTCLVLAILALAVTALGLAMQLAMPALDPKLPEKYKELREQHDKLQLHYENLAKQHASLLDGYRKVQRTAGELNKQLFAIASNALREKADDLAKVTLELKYRVQNKLREPAEVGFPAENWLELCKFLDECAKQLSENQQAEQKPGEMP